VQDADAVRVRVAMSDELLKPIAEIE